jgi:hypothetical protein
MRAKRASAIASQVQRQLDRADVQFGTTNTLRK